MTLLALNGTVNTDEFWRKFFACCGEFDAAEFWKSLPNEYRLPGPATESSSTSRGG